MTRNELELVTEIIKKSREMGEDLSVTHKAIYNLALYNIAHEFADRLRGVNSNFNKYRFLDACNIK